MAVKGVQEVIAELRKIGKDIDKNINLTTEEAAFFIEKNAKKLAPKNFGKLAQSISTSQPITDRNKSLINRVITVNELYGAYMEFGTGAKVSVPTEFKDMAASFKGQKTGTFKEALESIKAWCRAKGIDEKAAYPIFAKILGAGINPRPFLYPSWIEGKKQYLKDLENLLKTYNKKI
jgi:HK97 gp10 family phage protein